MSFWGYHVGGMHTPSAALPAALPLLTHNTSSLPNAFFFPSSSYYFCTACLFEETMSAACATLRWHYLLSCHYLHRLHLQCLTPSSSLLLRITFALNGFLRTPCRRHAHPIGGIICCLATTCTIMFILRMAFEV